MLPAQCMAERQKAGWAQERNRKGEVTYVRKNGCMKAGIITACMVLLVGLCDCGSAGDQMNTNVSATTGVKDVLQAQMEKENKGRDGDGQGGNTSAEAGSNGQEGNTGAEAGSNTQGGNTGTEAEKTQNAGEGEASEKSAGGAKTGSETEGTGKPDVDLTVMSATMIYSEVYNMMFYPETYVGKVIKIKGQYAVSEAEDMRYDLCIIKDATACCAQGMEFLLTDAYVYPQDYPKVGDEIELIGTFDTYYEGEYLYCTLRNTTLLSVQ